MKRKIFTLLLLISTGVAFGQNYEFNKDLMDRFELVEKTISQRSALDAKAWEENTDFEYWSSAYNFVIGDIPYGWLILSGKQKNQKLSGGQSGNFAIHLESAMATNAMLGWKDELVGGGAKIGNVKGMSFEEGSAYDKRLTSVSFYIKGELKGNDTSLVIVRLSDKDKKTVGQGLAFYGKNDITNEWQQKTLKIDYQGDAKVVKIDFIVSNTGVGVFVDKNYGTLTEGSYIDFDNLELEFATSAVDNQAGAEISLYPNPTSDFLTLQNAKNSQLSIFNCIGQLITNQAITSERQTIDVSKLPRGIYLARIKNGENTIVRKIEIL